MPRDFRVCASSSSNALQRERERESKEDEKKVYLKEGS